MRTLLLAAAAALIVGAANAYEIVDGSGADIPAETLDPILTEIADMFRDPMTVQFRRVRIGAEDALCGEVNAKNGFGAYVGFEMFYRLRPETPPVIGLTMRCR